MTISAHPKKQRSCVMCGKQESKGSLYRIVRTPSGEVCFDPTGRASGRGAYVCSGQCFAKACKTGKLGRSLKVQLGSDDYENIADDLMKAFGEADR